MVGLWILGRLRHLAATGVQHEVVVVAFAVVQLLIFRANALADGVGLAEIEWRAFHGLQLAGRNQTRVHWSEAVRHHGQDMLFNTSPSPAPFRLK